MTRIIQHKEDIKKGRLHTDQSPGMPAGMFSASIFVYRHSSNKKRWGQRDRGVKILATKDGVGIAQI
jgi:hypothetical protein